MRGDLVLREIVASAIGNLYAVYRNQFLELDMSMGDVLCAVMGIPEKEGHSVRKIMSDLAYGAIKEAVEKITAFIKRN